VESALAAARDAVKSDNVDRTRTATTELQQASHAMAEALYKANQGQPSSGGATSSDESSVKEGEVVDEEFAGTR
jgi:molecular chaperone DnaK